MSLMMLLMFTVGLPLLAVAAGFATVTFSYWWELRRATRTGPARDDIAATGVDLVG